MAFVYADFIAIYPEFSDLAETAVTFKGNLADKLMHKSNWGDFRTEAVYLWTAHKLGIEYNIGSTLKKLGKTSGVLNTGLANSISASNASLSQSFTNNALVTSDNPLYADMGKTTYGLEWLQLLQMTMSYGYPLLSGPYF